LGAKVLAEATISRPIVVSALGTTQTLAWASSYYLPAILADDIAEGASTSRSWVFGIFSGSLLLSAALGPWVGRMIDRQGGHRVLVGSNIIFAAGLAALALSTGVASLAAAWCLLGIGMALGLYDAAFATLTAIFGRDARSPITGITLFAGFASTVGWPLSAFLDAHIGWRGTCVAWAGLHVVVGLPLNVLLIPRAHSLAQHEQKTGSWEPRREMILLAYVFAASWFVTGAMAAHLPALLESLGATATEAIAAAALVGPAQVAARLAEFFVMRHAHPLVSARIAACMHPAGAAIFAMIGPWGAALFTLLHGAGNGLLTIARGTVPLAIFGPEGYGARTGVLGAPSRAAQALAPFLFGLLLDRIGPKALVVSAGLCLSALVALLALSARGTVER
jgi:MFS family permease